MILRNSAVCLECKEEIVSRHRHDHVSCKCGDMSVDGGLYYLKRGGNYLDTSLTTKSSFLEIRENFEWGSYGKDGKSKLKYIKLKDMEKNHIEAILDKLNLPSEMRNLFLEELYFRNKNINN